MLSSKIDKKALNFLKKIAKKEKKCSKKHRLSAEGGDENPSTDTRPQYSHAVHSPKEGDSVVGNVEEVVSTETGYHHYGNILDTSQDTEARIRKIVQDDTASPRSHDPVEVDVVTIAPRRGQVHRLTGRCPELATDACDLCGYRSSKEGVLRHKQRRHPKTVYKCQVCHAGFGVRYDMRRHRLNHFTSSGQLNKRGQRLWVKNHPEVDPDLVQYQDFEENFVSTENAETSKAFKGVGGNTEPETSNKPDVKQKTDDCYDEVVKDCEKVGVTRDQNNPQKVKVKETDSEGGQQFCDRLGDMSTEVGKQLGTTPQTLNASTESDPPKTKNTRKQYIPRYPPKDTSRVDCPECGKNFPQKVLAVHRKIHTHKPAMVCPHCPVEFTERCRMNVHIRAKHSRDFACSLCGKVLSSSTGLKQHIEGAHSDKVICLICQKKLSNQQSLYIHMKREHSNQWKHSCTQCGKKFFDRRSLKYHSVSHMDADVREEAKPFRCPVCSKRFLRKQTLVLHQNTHVGMKPFRCERCGKAFSFASLLTKHMKVHSDVRAFPCPHCHKAFKFACKLKYHMIIHTKERKHVCGKCDKIFTTSTGLRRHVCKTRRIYKNALKFGFHQAPELYSSIADPYQDFEHRTPDSETVYVCGVCNQAFINAEDANTHVLTHEQTHEQLTLVVEDSDATYMTETVLEEGHQDVIDSGDVVTENYGCQAVIHQSVESAAASCINEDVVQEEVIVIYPEEDGETDMGGRVVIGDYNEEAAFLQHTVTNSEYMNNTNVAGEETIVIQPAPSGDTQNGATSFIQQFTGDSTGEQVCTNEFWKEGDLVQEEEAIVVSTQQGIVVDSSTLTQSCDGQGYVEYSVESCL